jgi:hypothetical protein
MAYIQRPGAQVIASEHEWRSVSRYVLPDAIPIIILWPFSPIRFVYELEDTGPPVDRASFSDPFAVQGEIRPSVLAKLTANLKKQKHFKISIESRRQGFKYAGSAAPQGLLPVMPSSSEWTSGKAPIGKFAGENVVTQDQSPGAKIPTYRVTVNDRLSLTERFTTISHELGHIFGGHLGGCLAGGSKGDEGGWPARQGLDKSEREVEAEAVAYLVASRAGIITSSAQYLRLHAKKVEMSKVDLDLIVRAAARIERLGEILFGSMAFKTQS